MVIIALNAFEVSVLTMLLASSLPWVVSYPYINDGWL